MAFTGQGFTQSKQTEHSVVLVERGSSGTAERWQIFLHFPQSIQALLTFRLIRGKREKTPRRAPSEQMLLHQNLTAKISKRIRGTVAKPAQTMPFFSRGENTNHPQKIVDMLNGSKRKT